MLNQNKFLKIFFSSLSFLKIYLKNYLPPKSPLDEIFTNFPFLISPINLNLFNFSELVSFNFFKINFNIFIYLIVNIFIRLIDYLGKLVASKLSPLIKISPSFLIKKLLFAVFEHLFFLMNFKIIFLKSKLSISIIIF